MTLYQESQDIFTCLQHNHNSHSYGICPYCLTDRLAALCPDCANLLPCSCSCSRFSDTASTSSSTSSTFSISNLLDNEPPFLPARSAFPFFRSARFSDAAPSCEAERIKPRLSFWSGLFGGSLNKDKLKFTRSKSVVVGSADDLKSSPLPVKGKGWHFGSTFKGFWSSKASKVAHQRSPLRRV